MRQRGLWKGKRKKKKQKRRRGRERDEKERGKQSIRRLFVFISA